MRSKFQHGGILKNGVSLQENKVCGFSTRNFAKYMLKTSAFTQRMQTANNFLYIFQHDHFFINRMTYMTFLSPLRCKHTLALHSRGAAAVQLDKVTCVTIDTMSMFYSKIKMVLSVPRALCLLTYFASNAVPNTSVGHRHSSHHQAVRVTMFAGMDSLCFTT